MPLIPLRDGQCLHVRIVGQGQPVLLLPGLGMSSRVWLPFIHPYQKDFRFYMPDFRGAGLSARTSYNQLDIFQNNMEDVQDVVRHFALRDILLAGYSLGASTSLHWLRQDGFACVRRYLHIDQSACIPNSHDWPHGLLGPRQPILLQGLRHLSDLLDTHRHCADLTSLPWPVRQQAMGILADTCSRLGVVAGVPLFLSASAYMPRLLQILAPNPSMATIRACVSSYLNGHDYRACLQGSHVPMTFWVGMQSSLYHPQGQIAVAQSARHGRLVRFETSGHLLLVREPGKFRRCLGNFLRDCE